MRPPGERSGERRSVAVCITGMQRNLLEEPVRRTYHAHVIVPLTLAGWHTATHLSVSLPPGHASVDELERQMRTTYQARSVTLIPEGHAENWCLHNTSSRCRISRAPRPWERQGDLSVLVQWYAIGLCFDQVEADERVQRCAYDWLMRVRTDMVYFADIPLAAPNLLDAQTVYVASGGMTSDPSYRCMNDQFFLCPRGLCRAYFKLLELWGSPYCNATTQRGSRMLGISIDAGSDHLGPPEAPFELPSPPMINGVRGSAQWYMFVRYNLGAGNPCKAMDETAACCGLIRELAFPYTIARYQRRMLDCQPRLNAHHAILPSGADFTRRPSFFANRSTIVQRCIQVEGEWRNASPGWRELTHHPQTRVLSV